MREESLRRGSRKEVLRVPRGGYSKTMGQPQRMHGSAWRRCEQKEQRGDLCHSSSIIRLPNDHLAFHSKLKSHRFKNSYPWLLFNDTVITKMISVALLLYPGLGLALPQVG